MGLVQKLPNATHRVGETRRQRGVTRGGRFQKYGKIHIGIYPPAREAATPLAPDSRLRGRRSELAQIWAKTERLLKSRQIDNSQTTDSVDAITIKAPLFVGYWVTSSVIYRFFSFNFILI